MTEELRKGFHEELDELGQLIVRMGGHVSEAIPRGTDAFLDNDLAAAQLVIEDDDILDSLSIELEERCYQLLALQQPMASDLRAIVAAMAINGELERSGDLMTNIAKATRRMYGSEIAPKVRGLLLQMSDEAGRLIRLAIDSYVEADAGLAAALDDVDDRLDALNTETVEAVFHSFSEDEQELQPAVQLALVCRFYERIGDHAVNVGERVRYMVDGWLPEHTGALRAAARKSPRDADSSNGP